MENHHVKFKLDKDELKSHHEQVEIFKKKKISILWI